MPPYRLSDFGGNGLPSTSAWTDASMKATRLTVLLAVAHFSHHLATGILVPLLPAIREDFELSYFNVGLLVAAFTVSYGCAQLPMSALSGRFGSSSVLAAGLIGTSLFTAALGLGRTYWQLILCLIALGLIGGTYHAPASSLLSKSASPRHRGRRLGVHIVGGSASSFLTPLVAVFIARQCGTWRASFLLLGSVPLLMGILLWSVSRGLEQTSGFSRESPSIERDTLASWSAIVRPVSAMIAVSVSASTIFYSVYSYLPFYLEQGHGISGGRAAVMVGLVAGAGVIGGPVGGALSDRLGPKWVVLASLAASGPLLFAATWVSRSLWLPLAVGAYGVVVSARLASMEALIVSATPADHRVITLGAYYLATLVATSLITPVVGHFIDSAGPVTAFLWLAGIVSSIGVIGLTLRKHL
jgi:MFS family permease